MIVLSISAQDGDIEFLNDNSSFIIEDNERIEQCENKVAYYKSIGNFKEAYFHLRQLKKIKDSLLLVKKNLFQEEVNSILETKSKENQIELLNTQNIANEETIKARNTQQFLYFGGAGIMIVILFTLWHRIRITRRTRDLVQRKNNQLEKEKTRAENSEKFRQSFLANISHEIRTPLNAIMGISKILINSKHSKEQEKYLDVMYISSKDLLVLINDILDLSKLEAGKVELLMASFYPKDIVDSIIHHLDRRAVEKRINLISQWDENIPELLIGDAGKLKLVLYNLVRNGIIFTQQGDVKLSATLLSTNDNQASLQFKVKDSGIGILKEKQESILKTFVKVYEKESLNYDGSGLELPIISQILELQGGSIQLESEPGKGSTFTVDVPYEIDGFHITRDGEELKDEVAIIDGISVLLVEDTEFNVMVAEAELNSVIKDLHMDVAVNGKIAVEMIQKNQYDIVLMDVQMPEMNGYEATRAIRGLDGATSAIPIIAMTANDIQQEIDKCFESGMDAYVPKPFESKELVNKISRLLAKKTTETIA